MFLLSYHFFFSFYSNHHLDFQNVDFWGLPLLAVKWWSKDTNRLTAKKDRCTVTIIHSQSTSRQYWPVHLTLLSCLYESVPFEQNPVFLKDFASSCPQFEVSQHPSHCYLKMNDHHPPLNATLFQKVGATLGPH